MYSKIITVIYQFSFLFSCSHAIDAHIISRRSPDQCQTKNGTSNGDPCIFPFKLYHYGNYYGEFHGCTKMFDGLGKYWCPTKLNDNGEFHFGKDKHFGHCSQDCPEENDCAWSSWSSWSECSVSCGSGEKTRTRTILKEAELDGNKCSDEAKSETKTCQMDPCPVCKWNEWSDWNQCERGIRRRYRNGNEACPKDHGIQTEPCPAVDCKWSQWGGWSPCSKDCGNGVQRRKRSEMQFAAYGGAPCEGKSIETRHCKEASCNSPFKVDCLWSQWSKWSSETYGTGFQERYRQISQYAENGGQLCRGQSRQTKECLNEPCPTD